MKAKKLMKFHQEGARAKSQLGDDLDVLDQDRNIFTEPEENKRRRTVVINRQPGEQCGFTLQSYGILKKCAEEMELLTFVDYVELGGAAHRAGLRRGDVILSVDGVSVESFDHESLVSVIRASQNPSLRMVVLFDDCCRKIDLNLRYMKLENLLSDKLFQLHLLERQELRLLHRDSDSQLSNITSTSNDTPGSTDFLSVSIDHPRKTNGSETTAPNGINLTLPEISFVIPSPSTASGVTDLDCNPTNESNSNNVDLGIEEDVKIAALYRTKNLVAQTASSGNQLKTTAAGCSSLVRKVSNSHKSFTVDTIEVHRESLLWTLNPPSMQSKSNDHSSFFFVPRQVVEKRRRRSVGGRPTEEEDASCSGTQNGLQSSAALTAWNRRRSIGSIVQRPVSSNPNGFMKKTFPTRCKPSNSQVQLSPASCWTCNSMDGPSDNECEYISLSDEDTKL